jgi:hypothetical protein
MKPTKIALAKHIGITPQGLNKMKNDHPKKFELLWMGWVAYLKQSDVL